jgi:ribosomal protein S6E (S10)
MVTQFSIVGGADAKRFTLKKGNIGIIVRCKVFHYKTCAPFFRCSFFVIRIITRVSLGYGYSKSFISRLGRGKGPRAKPPVEALLKDFDLNTNVFKNMVTQFSIVGGADAKRFTLKKGNKLTFKATAFKAQSNTYHVKIIFCWF